MKNANLTYIFLVGILIASCAKPEPVVAQERRERVEFSVDGLFQGVYSEVLEQPLEVSYTVPCADGKADRTGLDFFEDPNIHTSDDDDYSNNVWDKGHLAPAATFSDSMENLKQTFSYLNCALQDQYLNRGEWRLLEEKERDWDDESNLTVTVELVWDEGYIILPTGGHVPTDLIKHIYFEKTGSWKCFEFENVKPEKGWEEHEVVHNHD